MQEYQPRAAINRISRRTSMMGLGSVAAAQLATSISPATTTDQPAPVRPTVRVAAILTEFCHRSHAHVLLENFLKPYLFCGRVIEPDVQVVSMYVDQLPSGDMARHVSRDFDIPLAPTIREALTLGGNQLACDAVLSIAEHGQYPTSRLGQQMYPRKRFFDQIAQTMRKADTCVPLFSDKHLSYRWDWAHQMYATAQQMGIPMMAGSAVPLAHRVPPLTIPRDTKLKELLLVHGGGTESYDFHAVEVLQSIVEALPGAEDGVSSVQWLEGDAVWQAAQQRVWNPALVEIALRPELGEAAANWRAMAAHPNMIVIRYKSGLVAPLLTVPGNRWAFACRQDGTDTPQGCQFHVGPWMNRNLFKALAHAIQSMFTSGCPAYPVERTLLTTGITEAAMISRHRQGAQVPTGHLEFAYRTTDDKAFRENGESWKILNDNLPEPAGIHPLGNPPIAIPGYA